MFRMRKKQHVCVLLEVILWIKRCDDAGRRGEAATATLFNRLRGGDASTDQAQQEPACSSPGGGVAACPPARRLAHAQIWQWHNGISIPVTSIFSGEGGKQV